MPASFSSTVAHDNPLRSLAGARRVFDRLDWWQVEEWQHSDAWTTMHEGGDGALLAVPTDIDEETTISQTRSDTAWLRWCAVADGRSASGVMRALFAHTWPRLLAHGVRSVWAIADTTDWIAPYLADAGFAQVDRMLTYQVALSAAERWLVRGAAHDVAVRTIHRNTPGELNGAIALDEAVFDEPWRYGRLLRRAFDRCDVVVVAVGDSAVLGYACAVCDGERAHVVRLAVAQAQRGHGVGAQLLRHVATEARTLGARLLSLNTQLSNTASQPMYARLGFQQRTEQPHVFRCVLTQATT